MELFRDRDIEISLKMILEGYIPWPFLMWRSGLVFGAGNGRLVGLNGAQIPAVAFLGQSYILPLSTLFHGLPLL